MPTLILYTPLLVLAIGALVLWVNPTRRINQVFALVSLTTTFWIYCVFMAIWTAQQVGGTGSPVPWVRAASAVGAFFPLLIWGMKESILSTKNSPGFKAPEIITWFVVGCVLAWLCTTDSFILDGPDAANRPRGLSYYIYIAVSFALYLFLIVQTFRQWRMQTGIHRLEIQFLILNAGIACLLAVIVTAAGNYFNLRALSRLTPLIILVFYALTAWAVTVHRIFDARQVLLSVAQRLALVLLLCLGIFGLEFLLRGLLPSVASLLLSIAVCSSLAFLLERKTREWFRLNSEEHVATLRRTMIDLARSEPNPDKLVAAFEGLLRTWGQANYARLLFDSGEVYASGDLEFTKDRPAHAALCRSGWTTPESLQRQRAEPGLVDLRQFLTEFDLGLAVSAPRGSPTPSLLVVLGTKVNHRPFTYPEVQQFQEIAEFMDNILARSRLTMQARQSEQLATIGLLGASLAHEIRNPLVSIKTFAHLLPTRFDDPEFRRRFNVLIPAEVDRIDSLTQQLLDLSNPRRHQMERISLHAVARETLDLMLTRAAEARVSITSTYSATADTVWADASAIRQVLINLLINAFQALDQQETDRRVDLRTRNSPGGSVILEVSDNGPGIPPDQRARLFHPFVSTKTKGMGLGLAVCADILHEHKATIIVPDIERPGATFRITFPCPPPSS